MKLHSILTATAIAAAGVAAPAGAVVNLIDNGSFEAGPLGNGPIPSWVRTNTPDFAPSQDVPAAIIRYNNTNAYPTGAFGELVTPDNVVPASPDAVGSKAAYFVGDFSVNETLSQLTYLGVGNYKIGFSYYLTQNGLNNVNNASLSAQILSVPVANTVITGTSGAQTWFYASGVARINVAGHYLTSLVYNSNGFPSKDVVVDRVFGVRTNETPTAIIPGTPSFVPEPQTWAMFVLGFGLVGTTLRRRKSAAVSA